MKFQKAVQAALCAVVILGAGAAARASSITFTATDNLTRSASATFSVSSGKLKIVLTNTSMSDTMAPSDLLTGVFWSMSGTPTLAVDKVVISSAFTGNPASTAETGASVNLTAGANVSGEFAFKATAGAAGAHTGANFSNWAGAQYGVASSGLSASGSGDGTFGVPDLFSTNNLNGPLSPDGPNYGLASKGDTMSTGNGGISGVPIIKDSVTITLTLPWGSTFNPATGIGSVWFQYGTSLSETRISSSGKVVSGGPTAVPLPGAVWMGLATLGGMGLVGGIRRRLRKN